MYLGSPIKKKGNSCALCHVCARVGDQVHISIIHAGTTLYIVQTYILCNKDSHKHQESIEFHVHVPYIEHREIVRYTHRLIVFTIPALYKIYYYYYYYLCIEGTQSYTQNVIVVIKGLVVFIIFYNAKYVHYLLFHIKQGQTFMLCIIVY